MGNYTRLASQNTRFESLGDPELVAKIPRKRKHKPNSQTCARKPYHIVRADGLPGSMRRVQVAASKDSTLHIVRVGVCVCACVCVCVAGLARHSSLKWIAHKRPQNIEQALGSHYGTSITQSGNDLFGSFRN